MQKRLPNLVGVLEKYPVTKAYIFGSACSDAFGAESDIDLIICLDESLSPLQYGDVYWELDELLPKILGRKVDLLTEKMVRNPYFIKVVDQTKTLIYER